MSRSRAGREPMCPGAGASGAGVPGSRRRVPACPGTGAGVPARRAAGSCAPRTDAAAHHRSHVHKSNTRGDRGGLPDEATGRATGAGLRMRRRAGLPQGCRGRASGRGAGSSACRRGAQTAVVRLEPMRPPTSGPRRTRATRRATGRAAGRGDGGGLADEATGAGWSDGATGAGPPPGGAGRRDAGVRGWWGWPPGRAGDRRALARPRRRRRRRPRHPARRRSR